MFGADNLLKQSREIFENMSNLSEGPIEGPRPS